MVVYIGCIKEYKTINFNYICFINQFCNPIISIVSSCCSPNTYLSLRLYSNLLINQK